MSPPQQRRLQVWHLVDACMRKSYPGCSWWIIACTMPHVTVRIHQRTAPGVVRAVIQEVTIQPRV